MTHSNIGRALEKIVNSGGDSGGGLAEPRYDNTIRKRRFEYEDGVIARSVEAREQIKRMEQPFTFSKEDLAEHKIVIQGGRNHISHTLLKDLRNRITLKNAGLGSTVLVTSVADASESMLLSRSLAAIIASDENRTSLLLEAQETGSTLTGTKEVVSDGLSSFINNEDEQVGNVIYPTGVPRMRIIPFGASEFIGYEYLRSTRMRILIKDVTRRYPRERFTIIDAPPVDQVSDVELLNEYATHVLLCVPYGKVSEREVKRSLSKLDEEKLLGVIITGSPVMPKSLSGVTR